MSASSKWAGGTTQSPEVLFGLHIKSVPVLMLNILGMRNCRYQESMFTFVAVLGGFFRWTQQGAQAVGRRHRLLMGQHSSDKDDSCKYVELAVADRQQKVDFSSWGGGLSKELTTLHGKSLTCYEIYLLISTNLMH